MLKSFSIKFKCLQKPLIMLIWIAEHTHPYTGWGWWYNHGINVPDLFSANCSLLKSVTVKSTDTVIPSDALRHTRFTPRV